MNRLRIIAAIGLLTCAACTAWAVVTQVLRHFEPLGVITLTSVVSGLFALSAYAAYLLNLRRAARAGLCRNCGYDLRGLRNAPRCPECGRPIDHAT